jgi:hypothetical protein
MGVMMDTVLMMRANEEWSVFLLRIPPSVFVSYFEVCRNATNALSETIKSPLIV